MENNKTISKKDPNLPKRKYSKKTIVPVVTTETSPINPAREGLIAISMNIPSECSEMIIKGVHGIKHFNGSATFVHKLFEPEHISALIVELKEKDAEISASIGELAEKHNFIL